MCNAKQRARAFSVALHIRLIMIFNKVELRAFPLLSASAASKNRFQKHLKDMKLQSSCAWMRFPIFAMPVDEASHSAESLLASTKALIVLYSASCWFFVLLMFFLCVLMNHGGIVCVCLWLDSFHFLLSTDDCSFARKLIASLPACAHKARQFRILLFSFLRWTFPPGMLSRSLSTQTVMALYRLLCDIVLCVQ